MDRLGIDIFGGNNQKYTEYMEHLKQRRANAGSIFSGAQEGSLNKDEFISLGEFQNGTEWLRGTYLKDGILDENERATILERQKLFDELYKRYSVGDFHPETKPDSEIGKKHLDQLGELYDGISSENINGKEGSIVLWSMNSESQDIGSQPKEDALNHVEIGIPSYRLNVPDTQQFLDLFKSPGDQSADFPLYDFIT